MAEPPPMPQVPETTVVVVDPDPAWPAAYEQEAARLRDALGDLALRIEHYGSTAVPGLAAKPTIDVIVTVEHLDAAELERRLATIGYVHVPFLGSQECLFFARPAHGRRTHHLHACPRSSGNRDRVIAVRDYLRAHPEEAAAYARLKRDLAARFAGDRAAYIAGKDPFVKALERRAVAWAARP